MSLTAEQLGEVERLLLRDRRRILKELAHYDEMFAATTQESDGDLSAFSFHMADQGTDAMEREKAFLFAGEEGRLLRRVYAALRRLYRDPAGFGRCETCGGDIGFARLEALPYAELCIECRKAEESRGDGS